MALSSAQIDSILLAEADHQCDGFGEHHVCVRIEAIADLPSRFGHFQILGFWNNRDGKEHVAVMHGDAFGGEEVPTRLHSSCLTGDALGSLRCDCRDQLEKSLRAIAGFDRGLVLYMQQEGRGIGLLNKLRAYYLQDRGLDTVEANQVLGFRDDEREYSVAAHMLASMKVKSIRLMTNNPRKIEELTSFGVRITGRLPHVIPPNEFNRFYLETKSARSGHQLGYEGKPRLLEQGEPIRVENEQGD
jgi:GTP cyclohydrolase II